MDKGNNEKDVASLFTDNTVALFMDADLFKGYSTCLKTPSSEVNNIHFILCVSCSDQSQISPHSINVLSNRVVTRVKKIIKGK